MNIEQLKYPLGKFVLPASVRSEELEQWVGDIESLPGKLYHTLSKLSEEQMNQSYRPGGWTVSQVVHHIADSHMNGILRFKWALSESGTVIKPFDEQSWARFGDYQLSADVSLRLIYALHDHFVCLMRSLDPSDWTRTYTNPQSGTIYSLEQAAALYSWHGRHHHAQISLLTISADPAKI